MAEILTDHIQKPCKVTHAWSISFESYIFDGYSILFIKNWYTDSGYNKATSENDIGKFV